MLILLRVKNKAAMVSLLLEQLVETGMLFDSGPERENLFHLVMMSSVVVEVSIEALIGYHLTLLKQRKGKRSLHWR